MSCTRWCRRPSGIFYFFLSLRHSPEGRSRLWDGPFPITLKVWVYPRKNKLHKRRTTDPNTHERSDKEVTEFGSAVGAWTLDFSPAKATQDRVQTAQPRGHTPAIGYKTLVKEMIAMVEKCKESGGKDYWKRLCYGVNDECFTLFKRITDWVWDGVRIFVWQWLVV